jgi:hypothetical protein
MSFQFGVMGVLVSCSFLPGQSQEGQGAHQMERKLRVQKFLIPDPTFFFLVVELGFELWALHLQSRSSTA